MGRWSDPAGAGASGCLARSCTGLVRNAKAFDSAAAAGGPRSLKIRYRALGGRAAPGTSQRPESVHSHCLRCLASCTAGEDADSTAQTRATSTPGRLVVILCKV